ncbi:CLAVATA3/ESR (CLE)-related protein 25-like [Neltuma alba]|uniref:CLAVATA3/ESR (CLE)-related protein 25-like n=1 Tax=Neltuma alba TaxID=207710 RepID=UPI0010A51B17|nr:CLAVATA3/ESR (CLE)-related protein 25-like [Prosopis alba]
MAKKTEDLHMGLTCSFLLKLLLVVGFVCLLLLGSLGTGEGRKIHHRDEIDRDKPNMNQQELDFNYMSKRRVPNGSDPIHNRRAGNSGRPPGEA